jgi:CBS domain-containing protein
MKSLKVRDTMSTNVITFAPGDSVVHAMATLLERGISGAPVVDEDGALVGILSEVDLIQVVVQDSYYDDPVGIVADFMQTHVECVDPDMDIFSLAQQFLRHHRRRYPVLENDRLVGQISRRDVLRAALDLFQA